VRAPGGKVVARVSGINSELPEFAVWGERGMDVFRRVEERAQRRSRYECIATVDPDTGAVADFAPVARDDPDRMRAAADRLRAAPLLAQDFALGRPQGYPPAGERPVEIFLYLDFFRHWQIAEQEVARVGARIKADEALSPPEVSGALRILLDFNRLSRAAPIVDAVLPALMRAANGQRDDRWQNAAYALRMVGDLRLRAGRARDALAAYEAALSLGVNPHRTQCAIRAAHAAQDLAAMRRHLSAYAERWPLPAPLVHLRDSLAPTAEGDSV